MSDLYSKREKPRPTTLREDVPANVRNRIYNVLKYLTQKESGHGGLALWKSLMADIRERCLREYGEFDVEDYDGKENSTHFYFLKCSDERALDFIEMCFRSSYHRGKVVAVYEVNKVLREEGIGYELSPWSEGHVYRTVNTEEGEVAFPAYIINYPEVVKKTNEALHQTVIAPTLRLLAGQEWHAANEHMLKAHEHYRHGDYRSANTECNSAFETVLKTICKKKGWKYREEKDVLSQLIDVCRSNGLFDPFYVEVFKASGILRNKLGGHGIEPGKSIDVKPEQAEHMLNTTSAHILLLARLAGF